MRVDTKRPLSGLCGPCGTCGVLAGSVSSGKNVDVREAGAALGLLLAAPATC